ncbi:hypothetical protein C0J52_05447 [Blattella germanica]|nr:hypothetical protein C0J52_05447 [Blattella germanica]
MAVGVRPSSSKNRMTTKRDTNYARTRRLAPLTKSSESKIGTVKVSSSLCHADKKVKTGIENVSEDSERKENLSSFQVGSCSQSSSCVKVSKVFPEPKENIGPSQRCPATSKKLKSAQSSSGGVLKQVLAVRTKCAAVGALANGSKLNKGNITAGRIQRIQTLGNVTVLRKGTPMPSPTNMRVAKFRRPSITKLSQEQNQNEFNPLGAATKIVSECKLDGDIRKGIVKSVDKIKCVKDDQTVVKQGPKRLKISPFKVENSSGVASLSDVSCKRDGAVMSKVKLKEISVDKFCKERKLSKKLDSNSKPVALINKCDSISFSQDSDVIWNVEQEAQATSLDIPSDSSSTTRGKSLRRNNTAKSTSPIACQSTSSGSKVKHSTKSEKQGKGRAPHLSPIKTLQKKKSVDSGRKRGKVSLRSIATSVSRLRAPSNDASQSVQPEKKRKMLKSKLP